MGSQRVGHDWVTEVYMGRQNNYNIQKYFDGEEEGRRGGEWQQQVEKNHTILLKIFLIA